MRLRRIGRAGRKPDDGLPFAFAVAELTQGLGVMGAGVVPHHDRRATAELPTGRGMQVGELARKPFFSPTRTRYVYVR
nr:transposase [uncultured bacterium]